MQLYYLENELHGTIIRMSKKVLVVEGSILLNYHFSKISTTTATNVFLKAVCSKFFGNVFQY